ncbi:MAG: hypothetical protein M1833_005544 [Piccolia ochrophora]|nr:MAG: hypothetical protein M1833_005544 [Piccolia ochrophora]
MSRKFYWGYYGDQNKERKELGPRDITNQHKVLNNLQQQDSRIRLQYGVVGLLPATIAADGLRSWQLDDDTHEGSPGRQPQLPNQAITISESCDSRLNSVHDALQGTYYLSRAGYMGSRWRGGMSKPGEERLMNYVYKTFFGRAKTRRILYKTQRTVEFTNKYLMEMLNPELDSMARNRDWRLTIHCTEPAGIYRCPRPDTWKHEFTQNEWHYRIPRPERGLFGFDIVLCPVTTLLSSTPMPCARPYPRLRPGTVSNAMVMYDALIEMFYNHYQKLPGDTHSLGLAARTTSQCVELGFQQPALASTNRYTYTRFANELWELGYEVTTKAYNDRLQEFQGMCENHFLQGNLDDGAIDQLIREIMPRIRKLAQTLGVFRTGKLRK